MINAARVERLVDRSGNLSLDHLFSTTPANEPQEVPMGKQMALTHLTREVKTSLELAIAALAPSDLVDQLAIAAGLLEAIADMALDESPTIPLVARTTERAGQALAAWRRWQSDHPPKAAA